MLRLGDPCLGENEENQVFVINCVKNEGIGCGKGSVECCSWCKVSIRGTEVGKTDAALRGTRHAHSRPICCFNCGVKLVNWERTLPGRAWMGFHSVSDIWQLYNMTWVLPGGLQPRRIDHGGPKKLERFYVARSQSLKCHYSPEGHLHPVGTRIKA